jgi:hypothetical protein
LKLLFLEGLFLLYDGIGRHVTLLGVMPRGVGVRVSSPVQKSKLLFLEGFFAL